MHQEATALKTLLVESDAASPNKKDQGKSHPKEQKPDQNTEADLPQDEDNNNKTDNWWTEFMSRQFGPSECISGFPVLEVSMSNQLHHGDVSALFDQSIVNRHLRITQGIDNLV